MGFATRAPLAPPRSAQLPPDPFANFNQQLYPIPEGFQSFQAILRLIGMSQVLATAIATKATLIARMGWFPQKVSDNPDPEQRRALEDWIDDAVIAWPGGFCPIWYQVAVNRDSFGAGFIEVLPPALPPRGRAVRSPMAELARRARFVWTGKDPARAAAQPPGPAAARIAGVRHLERLHVRLMQPEQTREGHGPQQRVTFDPYDLLFPRLMYAQGGIYGATGQTWGAVRYLKAFGDPRPINTYTGKTDPDCPWEDLATEYMRWRNYWPGVEEGCFPWYPSIANIDTSSAILEYYSTQFRRNCIPDIILIVEGAEVGNADDQSKKISEKFRSTKQIRTNEGYEPKAMVLSFTVPPDDATGQNNEAVRVRCRIEKLNPIDGPTIQAILNLDERIAVNSIALALRMSPRFLNYVTHGSLGGGGEAGEEFRRMTQTVIAPDQADLHVMIDQLTRDGRGITDYRARLETPNLADPKTEAETAKAWSDVRGMVLDEIRDKIGLGPLRDAMDYLGDAVGSGELDPGKAVVLGADKAMTLDEWEAQAMFLMPPDQGGLPEGSARTEEEETWRQRSKLSPRQTVWLTNRLRESLRSEIAGKSAQAKEVIHGAA